MPPEDEQVFGSWADALTRGLDPDHLLTAADLARRAAATRDFAAYFRGLIAQRRSRPGDDLLSRLAAVREEGDLLTEAELLDTCALLLVAGYETTVNLVANAVLALARDAGQYALLRARPDLVPSVVDETLRYDPPIQWAGRTALADTDLAGRRFAAGDGIMLMIASAHRDAAAFPHPDTFDVTRYATATAGGAGAPPAARHLGFGHGVHYCLGAPLARLESEAVLAALVNRVSRVDLVVDPPVYRPH
nr:cytochrome P450 [Micromonospora sp. DSM 115978]